jgi:redox-sensitive bicupin YhaK (pirin superfamily)
VGLDIEMQGRRAEIPADPGFEYAVIPIDQEVKIDDAIVEPGWLALVPAGTEELPIEANVERARFLVLGGRPLGESIEMWWNFVARSKEEITQAWRAWQTHDLDRFGAVASKLARIDAPPPPWLTAG